MLSGVEERIPYSLSRWTDLPASRWRWFTDCLAAQQMVAFDPRTTAPGVWSLSPQNTYGLVFWTKDPTNLILDRKLLEPYKVTVHMTATGWSEVEKGAPTLEEAGSLLIQAAGLFEKVYWRFSPIPLLPSEELLNRFQRLLGYAALAKISQTFFSFLQPNDKCPETRSVNERFDLLNMLSDTASEAGVKVILCADDRTFVERSGARFSTDACVRPSDFGECHKEACGCALMADPFTINESCVFGCQFCYAADKSLSAHKRDTTNLKGRLSVLTR
jgi:hypothetical protein